MSIPIAVSPSVRTPGVSTSVDLLSGTASPGSGALRVALIAPKATDGDLTVNTEVRAGGGPASAATAFGKGSLGHLAAVLLYAKYPKALVDFIAPAAGSGSATLSVTAAGSPSGTQVVDLDIMGRTLSVDWNSGDTASQWRDAAVIAINALNESLFVTASAGSAGVLVLTAKTAGNCGNDVIVKAKLRFAQTGTETLTGAATPTKLTGGTTDPDFTTALASINGREYPMILPCLSNADVANVSSTNNLKRCRTHVAGHNSGRNAKLETVIAGYTGALTTASATTLDSDSLNNVEYAELALCINGRGLPCELGANECGLWLAALALDDAPNRIGDPLGGYVGAVDKLADKPTDPQIETALNTGVSIVDYDENGNEYMVRPISTHSQDSSGAPDPRLLDMQQVHGTYIVVRDVRGALPQEFPQAKISKDTAPGDDLPPPNTVEERDVKAFVLSRLRAFQRRGTVTRQSVDAAIADGTFIVQVDPGDAGQVDIVMPFSIVPGLAKFSLVAQRVPN